MQQHRQVEVLRDLQLLDVEEFLGGVVEVAHEQVEPDFADGDRPLRLDLRAQVGEVLGAMHVDVHRVQSPRRQAAGIARAGGGHRGEVVAADGRDDLDADAAGDRTRVFGVAVGVEFGRVEVAVGVDKKRRP